MGNALLKLVFDAPLQAYGRDSKWDIRGSAVYPSKSAVIGLIACAMGIERKNKKIDVLAEKLSVSVRIDRSGKLLTDLQTVNHPVNEAKGCIKKINGMEYHPLENKVYIQNAIFSVYLFGDFDIVNECYEALLNPIWPIFLGRKCCIPSRPVYTNEPIEFNGDIEEFIKNDSIESISSVYKKGVDTYFFQYFIEDKEGNILSYDNPHSQGQRFYTGRLLRKGVVSKSIKKEGESYVFE